jgi:phosphatidylinositol-3,4,5-trisphosphate 3-phosphatase/dual-specificity protein phosphatase PTEN
MACTYLLALGDQPSAPQLERSYTPKQWAKRRIDNTIGVLPEEGRPSTSLKHTPSVLPPKEPDVSDTAGIINSVGEPAHPSNPSPPTNPEKSFTHTLKSVLDLHTARRMKSPPPSELEKKKVKQGVSIPSQRQWLYYWALLLAGEAPKDLWPKRLESDKPRVRLTQIKVRMRETSSVKLGIVKAASLIMGRAGLGKVPLAAPGAQESPSTTQVWASLARYDDSLIGLLEKWEVWTRNEGGLGAPRRPGSEHMPRKDGDNSEVDDVSKLFEDGRWDKEKMVRPFARFGVLSGEVGFVLACLLTFTSISYSLHNGRTSPMTNLNRKKRIKTKTPQ